MYWRCSSFAISRLIFHAAYYSHGNMRLALASRRYFARKKSTELEGAPSGYQLDEGLMQIVKKHVAEMESKGMSPDEILQKSFGPDVLGKLPSDPDQAAIEKSGLDLANINMLLPAALRKDLENYHSLRSKAQPAPEAVPSEATAQGKVELPKGYKTSDIEKVSTTQRLAKLRSRDKSSRK